MPSLRSMLRHSAFHRDFVRPIEDRRHEAKWLAGGRAGPPPAVVKCRNILAIADLYGARAFVETGTFRGDTVARVLPRFDAIISFEIFAPLAAAARQRFSGEPKVRIIEGDSGALLEDAIGGISQPILFWLDAHYSGPGTGRADEDSPIAREMAVIHETRIAAGHRDAVLIDDARIFNGEGGYPKREPFMAETAARWGYTARTADDCLFFLPKP
jgi:hypothetical protein